MSKRFTDLERDGKIDKIPSNRAEVERLHAIVARDAATAEELRERNRDWALAIAYNALLQACLALMTAHGYRPRVKGNMSPRSSPRAPCCSITRPYSTDSIGCVGVVTGPCTESSGRFRQLMWRVRWSSLGS
jgi:hypothetical protein